MINNTWLKYKTVSNFALGFLTSSLLNITINYSNLTQRNIGLLLLVLTALMLFLINVRWSKEIEEEYDFEESVASGFEEKEDLSENENKTEDL